MKPNTLTTNLHSGKRPKADGCAGLRERKKRMPAGNPVGHGLYNMAPAGQQHDVRLVLDRENVWSRFEGRGAANDGGYSEVVFPC